MTLIYLSLEVPGGDYGECVTETCIVDGREHDKLWTVQRKPFGTGLYWNGINLNGEKVLIEGSLPNRVDRLPRDAKPVSPENAARVWHEDNESHVFGGPNVAKALREAIARENRRSEFTRA